MPGRRDPWHRRIRVLLGKMLRYAHEIELLEIVPRVKLLKVPQQRFDFLTFEELSRLVEAMKDSRSDWFWCCSVPKPGFGKARPWRSNGATWIWSPSC